MNSQFDPGLTNMTFTANKPMTICRKQKNYSLGLNSSDQQFIGFGEWGKYWDEEKD